MYEIITRLNNVSTHTDLNISQFIAETDPDIGKEAIWAEYSSAKFLFLGRLIEIAGQHDLHLILAVQDDKKRNIVEKFLRGKGFNYTRPREDLGGNIEVSLSKDSLSFGIHSNDGVHDIYRTPAAIFAFDTAFNPQSPSVQHIRTTYTRNGNLLPIIWFFVANTCEHIEHCLPDLPEPERLRLLLQYTSQLHDEVGDLQDDALGLQDEVEEILHYLLDSMIPWPLPIIHPLPLVSVEALGSSSALPDQSQIAAPKRALVTLYLPPLYD